MLSSDFSSSFSWFLEYFVILSMFELMVLLYATFSYACKLLENHSF